MARNERAAWFDEALPLIRRFWMEDTVDHDGPRFHYEGVRVLPKPTQQPPDVWLGGIAPSELRRVGRLARKGKRARRGRLGQRANVASKAPRVPKANAAKRVSKASKAKSVPPGRKDEKAPKELKA